MKRRRGKHRLDGEKDKAQQQLTQGRCALIVISLNPSDLDKMWAPVALEKQAAPFKIGIALFKLK
jgi:hypothetical protein